MLDAVQESPRSAETDVVRIDGEFLSFRLGREEYGIDILGVQEIRGYEAATRMINAPKHVLGVLNLRGVIVPVIDLRIRFGMDEVTYDSQTVTIVLNIGTKVVGVVVDAVSDVVALAQGQIKPAPEFTGAVNSAQIIGIATVEQGDVQRMLILLEVEKLMNGADAGLQQIAEA